MWFRDKFARLLFVVFLIAPYLAHAQPTSPAAVNGGVYNATPPTLSNLQQGVFQLDANGNLKTVTGGTAITNVTPTDCSGALTAGGTAQNAFAASATRKGFQIANIDTSEVMWISPTGTATASAIGSYPLAPGAVTTFANAGSYYSPIGFSTALSVVAATTGHKWSCTTW